MLVALHPVPAVDVRLEQAFATAQGGSVSVGRVEGNTVSPMRLNNAAPEDRRLQDKLVNMVRAQRQRCPALYDYLASPCHAARCPAGQPF